MKKLYLIIFIFLPNIAFAKINIFTCESEWANLAQEITSEKSNIFSATIYNQDPHHIQIKPSLIAKISEADMVFCSGANLESGWLPNLLKKAKKPTVKFGESGYLMAADFVDKNQNQQNINPHVHLDPRNITKIAQEFNKRIQLLDPINAQFYQKNYLEFKEKWQKSLDKWQNDAKKLAKMPIIIQHNAWLYLTNWLDLNVVAQIEEKPETSPSAKHLSKLLELAKNNQIDLIIYAPFEDMRAINWLSKKTNIKAQELPFSIDESKNINDLFAIFDNILRILQINKDTTANQK